MVKKPTKPKTRRFGGQIFKFKRSSTSMRDADALKAKLKNAGYKVRVVFYVDHRDIYYRK